MNICFIGGGNMANALIGGLLSRGFSAAQIRVVEINQDNCTRLHNEYGVRASADMAAGISHSEYVVLAIKPQQLHELSLQLAPLLTKQLIISNELSLTEIAFKLSYSSVAHLSTQFKNTTGITPSAFQRIIVKRREIANKK